MASEDADRQPMPVEATRNLFAWAAGFGMGALVVLAAFMLLIGLGDVRHDTVSPAGQSATNAPTAPGPSPTPSPNTASGAVPETTGQAPAPANPETKAEPTLKQQKQQKQQ